MGSESGEESSESSLGDGLLLDERRKESGNLGRDGGRVGGRDEVEERVESLSMIRRDRLPSLQDGCDLVRDGDEVGLVRGRRKKSEELDGCVSNLGFGGLGVSEDLRKQGFGGVGRREGKRLEEGGEG